MLHLSIFQTSSQNLRKRAKHKILFDTDIVLVQDTKEAQRRRRVKLLAPLAKNIDVKALNFARF